MPGQLHGLALRHYLHRAIEPGHLNQLVAACISHGRRRPGGTQRLVLRARAIGLSRSLGSASSRPPLSLHPPPPPPPQLVSCPDVKAEGDSQTRRCLDLLVRHLELCCHRMIVFIVDDGSDVISQVHVASTELAESHALTHRVVRLP